MNKENGKMCQIINLFRDYIKKTKKKGDYVKEKNKKGK